VQLSACVLCGQPGYYADRFIMQLRTLTPEDASVFQELRLQGLREAPTAFASSYEEECDTPLAAVA